LSTWAAPVGFGCTDLIVAHELVGADLNVVPIERDPWRDTAIDFSRE
jgi:gluconate 2-dehydrogenase alpha chain